MCSLFREIRLLQNDHHAAVGLLRDAVVGRHGGFGFTAARDTDLAGVGAQRGHRVAHRVGPSDRQLLIIGFRSGAVGMTAAAAKGSGAISPTPVTKTRLPPSALLAIRSVSFVPQTVASAGAGPPRPYFFSTTVALVFPLKEVYRRAS